MNEERELNAERRRKETNHVEGALSSISQAFAPSTLYLTTIFSLFRSSSLFSVHASRRLSRARAQQTTNESHHSTRLSRLSITTTGYDAVNDSGFAFHHSVCSFRLAILSKAELAGRGLYSIPLVNIWGCSPSLVKLIVSLGLVDEIMS